MLAGEARLQQDIKKSRLAIAAPIEEMTARLLSSSAVGTRDATHNCWAYKLGASYRFQ